MFRYKKSSINLNKSNKVLYGGGAGKYTNIIPIKWTGAYKRSVLNTCWRKTIYINTIEKVYQRKQ